MSAETLTLPTLRRFSEAVPELGIEKGDTAWVTHDSAVVVRRFTFAEIQPYLGLLQPIVLGKEASSG